MSSEAIPGAFVDAYSLSRKPGEKVLTEWARIDERLDRRPAAPRALDGKARGSWEDRSADVETSRIADLGTGSWRL